MNCKDFCRKSVNKTIKHNRSLLKSVPKLTKTKLDSLYKKALKNRPQELKKIKEEYKRMLKFIIFTKKNDKTLFDKKKISQECNMHYCNPGCKGTIYEDEPGTSYIKTLPQKTRSIIINLRKKLFNGKKSILENNFNEKITTRKKNELKKQGAISGCVNEGWVKY